MSSKLFESLLRNSKSLVDSPITNDTPLLQRNLGQIASESLLLSSNLKKDQVSTTNSHHFLAQSGSNTQEINQNLNIIDTRITFQPSETIPNNDVESYINRVQKDNVIATVNESNRNTREIISQVLENNLISNERDLRRRILEDWDYEQEDKKFGYKVQVKDQQVDSFKRKMVSFSTVVKELNKSRLLSERTPIIKKFKSLAHFTKCDKNQERSMLDSWDIASNLASESRENGLPVNTSIVYDNNDISATVKKNRYLINSAKTWLENGFMDHVKDLLNKNAVKAKTGGSPSLKHRIHAFMTLVFSHDSIWIDQSLEIQNNIPIWLYLYLFIRTGNYNLALDFVNDNPNSFRDVEDFPVYLKEYFSSPEKLVSDEHSKAILEQYQTMVYGNIVADPYKVLLYKIIGRCELDRKGIPIAIKTTEDYLWLELMLIRERLNEERYHFEKYRLSDFQKKITDAGPKYFDPNDKNPWFYFTILLLSLQFEKAIDHLYKSEEFRLEAVHFGIALAYYGLLRIPKEPRNNTLDLLITELDGQVSLNFSCLISQFVRLFVSNISNDALQYIYLITLYPTKDMTALCREYIINYIVGCKEYKGLIGYIDNKQGSIVPGSIEQYKPLFGIERYDGKMYKNAILYPIAKKFEYIGKYTDAVNVYELNGNYTEALNVLNRQLDHALDRRNGTEYHDNRRADQELIDSSNILLRNYENNIHTNCDEDVLNTHRILVQFLQAFIKYEEKNYEQALEAIKNTNVLPSSNDFEEIQLSARRFSQYTDVSIRTHVSQIIIMVMECYVKLKQEYSAYNVNLYNVNQTYIAKIKKESAVILPFISLINCNIPADIIRKLNNDERIIRGL